MDVITTHINADFDSLASMLAAKKLYPGAALVFPGSQEKNLRDFFLQSTFYVFETQRIKHIDLRAVRRLILVDTRQPGRIGKFAEVAGRPEVELHIYDHHPPTPDDLHGSVEVIREVGATVTLLARILEERKIALSPEEATVLALGLYEDTGSFTFSSTTVEDFAAAGFLLAKGANLNIVSTMITRELTPEQISLLNELIQSARKHVIKGIEVFIAKAATDKYVGDFALLAHKLKDMENMNVLFALAQMEERVYLVGRSRIPEMNVGEAAAFFGGGGHPTAAAATIKGMSLPLVEEKLLRFLEGRIKAVKQARELMAYPVKTIDAGETIEQAGALLTRYNINVVPVMADGEIVGLISRQVIEKAGFHGFKGSPVRDYMTSEFAVVHPNTSLQKIQDLIVGHNQRFLPVLDRKKLVGAITRTDLLRLLYADTPYAPSEREIQGEEPRKKWVLKGMEDRLPPRVARLLHGIGELAREMGFQAYAVGGFVRDLILRVGNLDIDVVVEGSGIELARKLAARENCQIRVHRKFGTATLTFPDGFKLDVATARMEYYDHPAALPNVEHSSIKMDLYRRDFTVNALAVHLSPEDFGELIDFFGGQRDIKGRSIRVLHNLSFVEDPTRIFRALRFEQRIGFQIARHTHLLMETAVRLELFGRLSGRRLFRELVLCLAEERPFAVLKRMDDFGLWRFFHPKLKAGGAMADLFKKIESVVSWYHLLFTGERSERWMVGLLAAIDGLTEMEVQELFSRLALPEKFRANFLERRRGVQRVIENLSRATLRRSEIYLLLQPLPAEFLLYAMGKAESDGVRKAISLYCTELKRTKVSLAGRDLLKMGYPPGPIYTEILQALLQARLDQKIQTHGQEVEFVQQRFPLGGKKSRAKEKEMRPADS